MKTIRFKRDWRQFKRGQTDSSLPYGIQDAYVHRGVAEWVTEEEPRPSSRKQKENKQ